MEAESASYSIVVLCRLLEVGRNSFYAWRHRQKHPSPRVLRDRQHLAQLKQLHERSRGLYGSPRLWHLAREQGLSLGRHATARLMRQGGLVGRSWRTSKASRRAATVSVVADNHVDRCFTTAAPDQVWVTDMTQFATQQGPMYLAVVIDLYARRVIGHATAATMHTDLPLQALRMAVSQRGSAQGVLHHSDQGSQYTSAAYQAELARLGMRVSMSRRGECWDNAVAESFFSTLKCEIAAPRRYASIEEARHVVFEYIEVFYNRQRLHSTNGYRSPAATEAATP
ncbi:IS3 family transposase [Xanthomonas sp. NCPPB 2632]|uniref:IS3 family transposase n=1 Tax=Xanthomonas sp. NCPPB 2632 TaxID=3240912 RepID=UPI003510F183